MELVEGEGDLLDAVSSGPEGLVEEVGECDDRGEVEGGSTIKEGFGFVVDGGVDAEKGEGDGGVAVSVGEVGVAEEVGGGVGGGEEEAGAGAGVGGWEGGVVGSSPGDGFDG